MWLCLTIVCSYLCQNYKNVFIFAVSIITVSGSIVLFFVNRKKSYYKKHVLHYKLMLTYEIIAMLASSCILIFIGIFYLKKNDGVYFWIYFLGGIPLIPIIINSSWINAKNGK